MLFHFFLLSDNYSSWHKVATHDGVQQGGKPSVHCSVTYQHLYSVDQKKPNRERLNVFCFRSTRVPIPVLYPFRIRSISVPCRFSIRFVLFCSHSVSIPLVSILGTRSEEWGFPEPVYKISDTNLHFMKWVETVILWENTNSKLKFLWWKCESRYSKNSGRWYCNFKAS